MVCIVDVANVEPRVQKIGGEREVKKKQQSIVKGEVASSRRGGQGGARSSCRHRCLRGRQEQQFRRGRVVAIVEGRGKRLRGKGWHGGDLRW